jgi:hypothetical protein
MKTGIIIATVPAVKVVSLLWITLLLLPIMMMIVLFAILRSVCLSIYAEIVIELGHARAAKAHLQSHVSAFFRMRVQA